MVSDAALVDRWAAPGNQPIIDGGVEDGGEDPEPDFDRRTRVDVTAVEQAALDVGQEPFGVDLAVEVP
ncbi:MAG: hypothetical protein ABWZ76_04505 [Acidimicrobiales bacterium]